MSALEGPKADATETLHFPKEPEVLSTPSEFFGALRAQHITPPTSFRGEGAPNFSIFGPSWTSFFAPNQATHTQAPSEILGIFYLTNPETLLIRGNLFCPGPGGPRAAGKLWPLGGRQALAPLGHLPDVRSGLAPLGHLTDVPDGGSAGRWSSAGSPGRWSSGGSSPPLVISRILPWDPRLPVAIPGELEGIPEEVSGWNSSELNSERIHVRFSRNRRWNSGGWHRPGKAESGGFSRCRGTPDFFRAAARGSVGKRANP